MARLTVRFPLVFASSLFVSGLLVFATAGTAKPDTTAVTGCVQKGVEANGFYIVENNKMWELSSRTVDLAKHVGHQVTVTGDAVQKTKAAETRAEKSEKAEASGKDYADLNVKSLKMISETCGG
jgi:hypothetical protein